VSVDRKKTITRRACVAISAETHEHVIDEEKRASNCAD